jgi:23S rRNA pseudouridine1911/1915/1917 synthase
MSEPGAGTTLQLEVPQDAAGTRLDQFLAARLEGTSRAALGRWIREGRVLIDGRAASKTGVPLKTSMKLTVRIPAAPPGRPRPESIAFDILYEDAEMIVVDKPAGVAVHPGHGRREGTLVNGLLGRGIRLAGRGAPDRPGIVHRLDLGTSGLLTVAKTDAAHARLARAFADREVRKGYRAIVWGHPDPATGSIERSIGRSVANPTRMAVRATRGRRRHARTAYRTLESLPGFAYLDVEPETGRTHQIRVHLESIRHPIVGDERYGGRAWRGVQDPLKRKALREFDRLALHALRLAFAHPATGKPLTFEAPLPAALTELLSVLRGPR